MTPWIAVLPLLAVLPADDAAEPKCPMHAQHTRQAVVDHSHEEATGLPSAGVEHHFLVDGQGGTIRLEVKDTEGSAARDRVRAHLREITRAFAAGDFSMPQAIHGTLPPGADTMKRRRDAITYAFAETPAGGTVRLVATDDESRAAVHAFLRFQIADHGTGDPDR